MWERKKNKTYGDFNASIKGRGESKRGTAPASGRESCKIRWERRVVDGPL